MIVLSGTLDPSTVNLLGVLVGGGGLLATVGWLYALLR